MRLNNIRGEVVDKNFDELIVKLLEETHIEKLINVACDCCSSTQLS